MAAKRGRPRLSGPDGPLAPRTYKPGPSHNKKPPGTPRRNSAKGKGFPVWWEAYFANLAVGGVKYKACHAAGIHGSTPSKWIEDNKGSPRAELYRQAEDAAMEAFRDRLRNEAVARGVEGWEEPVYAFYKGEVVYLKEEVEVIEADGTKTTTVRKVLPTVRKKSDLIFLALCNANLAEFNRQRSEVVNLTLEQLEILDSKLSDEEMDAFEAGEDLRSILRRRRQRAAEAG